MKLASVRIITDDVARLTAFYESIFGVQATHLTAEFAEIRTDGSTLAIGSTRTLSLFGSPPGISSKPGENTFIEFLVPNVDELFARISAEVEQGLVQAPTTMPWGNRSLIFRDPDGNLINAFAPVAFRADVSMS